MHDTRSQVRDPKSHQVTMLAIDKPKNAYDYVMDKDGMWYYCDMDRRNYPEAALIQLKGQRHDDCDACKTAGRFHNCRSVDGRDSFEWTGLCTHCR
jgi:hypothetical protein